MQSVTRGVLAVSCAAFTLSLGVGGASAAPIAFTNNDNLNHAVDPNLSAFFTATPDGLGTWTADNGWAPITPAQAALNSSITTAKSYSIVGNSTAAGGWTDGNKIPTGVTLTFNAQFTFNAIGQNYLTVPGNSSTTAAGGISGAGARGIGITFQNDAGGIDDMDLNEGIGVSAITVSNVLFAGAPTDPNYTFTPGTVSNFGTRVFRSNNFAEATGGMLLTNTVTGGTIGFGLQTGTVASNLVIDNGFTTGTFDAARQTGPYTLVVTSGNSVIKGIGMAYDVSYDITAIPEPTAAMLVAGGLAALGLRRRRR